MQIRVNVPKVFQTDKIRIRLRLHESRCSESEVSLRFLESEGSGYLEFRVTLLSNEPKVYTTTYL